MIMQMCDVNDKDLSLYANYTYCGDLLLRRERGVVIIKADGFTSEHVLLILSTHLNRIAFVVLTKQTKKKTCF